eukprot:Colp12_sorted_trinity150504_noHs@16202
MKITRRKAAQRVINFYKHNFNLHEPYQVIVDGTFCQIALKCKIHIAEQLPPYLGGKTKLMTTKCVLAELDLLGDQFLGAKLIAKRYEIRRCKHQESPVPATECIASIIGESNEFRYMVASQDKELRKKLSTVPGVPTLFINYNCILLESPSKASEHAAKQSTLAKIMPTAKEQAVLTKEKTQLNPETEVETKKRKRPKAPNPLSCQKKKGAVAEQQPEPKAKRPRKRRKKTSETVSTQEDGSTTQEHSDKQDVTAEQGQTEAGNDSDE